MAEADGAAAGALDGVREGEGTVRAVEGREEGEAVTRLLSTTECK